MAIQPAILDAPRVPPPGMMSFDQFLKWAEDGMHVEWADGKVEFMSPVSDPHNEIGIFLITVLGIYVRSKKLGVLRYEPYLMKTGPGLPGRAPDLMFIANENVHRLNRAKKYLEGPADLAIEIVSPATRSKDRKKKFAEYEAGGVREYWLIDERRKSAEWYALGTTGKYQLIKPDAKGLLHSNVLPGVWIDPTWLCQDEFPDELDVLYDWGVDARNITTAKRKGTR